MSARRFTDDAAIKAIQNKENRSVKQILRELNSSDKSGTNYQLIYKIVEKYGLDTSHWLGKSAAIGKAMTHLRVDAEKHFGFSKVNSHRFKHKLIRDGYKKRQCENCHIIKWNKRPAPLELHHKNGNKNDNRLENLQILCANCHAQTDNYCGKNIKMAT